MNRLFLTILDILLVLFNKIDMSYHFDLMILHSNNVNSRFQERSDKTGGAGKVLYLLNKLRREAEEGKGPPVLYLNAGDNFSPTPIYTMNQWDVIADYLNLLKTDAICLGNHDLNIGLKNLTLFLDRLQVPVLTSNIRFRYPQRLQAHIRPSKIFHINDRKVGVVGTTRAQTNIPSLSKSLFIGDEIIFLKQECSRLYHSGVDIIIILSHAGVVVDKLIAKFVDHVDVIVGSGRRTGGGWWQYKEVVKRSDGKFVPIIRDEGHMTSLGMYNIEFDQKGDVIQHSGRLLFLHAKIPAEPLKLSVFSAEAAMRWKKRAQVTLNSRCRKLECNFGNLIADSLVHYKALDYHGSIKTIGWTDYPISMIHAGMITRTLNQNFYLTSENIYDYIDFFDTYIYVRIYGSYLKEAILEAVQYYGYSRSMFLQFSGIHVQYNFTESSTNRIKRVTTRCGFCKAPFYSEMRDNEEYYIMVNFETFRRISVIEKKMNSVSKSYHPIGYIASLYLSNLPFLFAEENDRLEVLAKAARPLTSEANLFFLYLFLFIQN